MDPIVKKLCDELRKDIKDIGTRLLELRCQPAFEVNEGYLGQHGEMKANTMLAFRHIEDARMRVGKILQAADDGVSILDK